MLPVKIGDLTAEDYKQMRLLLRRSQKDMATVFGVHVNTWASWERGNATPAPRHYEDVGIALRLARSLEGE
jgi:DNA-binding transcriptional regulator YiaG